MISEQKICSLFAKSNSNIFVNVTKESQLYIFVIKFGLWTLIFITFSFFFVVLINIKAAVQFFMRGTHWSRYRQNKRMAQSLLGAHPLLRVSFE
jgi:hypothetical protein